MEAFLRNGFIALAELARKSGMQLKDSKPVTARMKDILGDEASGWRFALRDLTTCVCTEPYFLRKPFVLAHELGYFRLYSTACPDSSF